MVRRFLVPVLVAALTLAVAPSPSFGLGAGGVRPRFDDHYRCMYGCEERGLERPPRHPGWGSWPRSHPRPRPPARPSSHRRGCWLFCGGGGWGHGGWGHGGWGHGGWGHYDHDRYDRHRDRDDRGYDAHRHHPRGRDF